MKVTDEQAKELAREFAEQYLPGFRVERIVPFVVCQTIYSVELHNSKGELRTLRVNPYGAVSGPWRCGLQGRHPGTFHRTRKR